MIYYLILFVYLFSTSHQHINIFSKKPFGIFLGIREIFVFQNIFRENCLSHIFFKFLKNLKILVLYMLEIPLLQFILFLAVQMSLNILLFIILHLFFSLNEFLRFLFSLKIEVSLSNQNINRYKCLANLFLFK